MKKAYLVLSGGRVFEGVRIGADTEATGELVFTTGVVGYQETLADPSFAGQIVLQTFPLIGNYGVIEPDAGGVCAASGYVVRELCASPSNFRCEGDLDTWLRANDVPGIAGVDTRELTRILREEGTVTARICSEPVKEFCSTPAGDPVAEISCERPFVVPAQGEEKYRVTLVDYGTLPALAGELANRGCTVTVVPQDTSAKEILSNEPDGVVLSPGPGDPAASSARVAEAALLVGCVPVLGVGLGHQMVALGMGGTTAKMKYGHRGSNQPVRETNGQRTYITSQNHGYIVEDAPAGSVVSFLNANDASCEGLEYPGKNCISVQFVPGGAGASGTGFVYDRFISMMEGKSNA